MPNLDRHKIGFVGAGKVASVLAPSLVQEGYAVVAVQSKTDASARRIQSLVGEECRIEMTAQAVLDSCNLIFLTTPDDAIQQVTQSVRWQSRHQAIHCSGALDSSLLAPVRQVGGLAASFHPLQTFAATKSSLTGITFAIEGDPQLAELLKGIATDLGGNWIEVPGHAKALYHVAAVLVSNYTATLVQEGAALLRQLGVSEPTASTALLPLLQGTVENIERHGFPASLTGPVARGDVGTICKHLEEIRRSAPELLTAYRALGMLTVPFAESNGTVGEEAVSIMRGLFAEEESRHNAALIPPFANHNNPAAAEEVRS